jgi:hypothetical protein
MMTEKITFQVLISFDEEPLWGVGDNLGEALQVVNPTDERIDEVFCSLALGAKRALRERGTLA